MDPAKRGFLFEHGHDLYYATFDGTQAVRLTSNPGREQLPQFSPDGKSVAFVRDFDLYAVDIATQTERRLTTGGRDDLRHGHADWVYYEEIFNRRWPAFWWSPDSKKLAFLEFDDAGVPFHTVLDDASSGTKRNEEQTHYPRAGEPNPKVRLGIVGADGRPGPVGRPLRLLARLVSDQRRRLVARIVRRYCYVQNRTQTWLDFVKFLRRRRRAGPDQAAIPRQDQGLDRKPRAAPLATRTARSSGLASATAGSTSTITTPPARQQAQLTSGPWEVRRIEHVDSKNGWIYFTANRDTPMSTDLYRAKPGGPVERLTPVAGQPHGEHEPRRPALPVELVRHQDADRSGSTRPTAGWCGPLTPTRRTS